MSIKDRFEGGNLDEAKGITDKVMEAGLKRVLSPVREQFFATKKDGKEFYRGVIKEISMGIREGDKITVRLESGEDIQYNIPASVSFPRHGEGDTILYSVGDSGEVDELYLRVHPEE